MGPFRSGLACVPTARFGLTTAGQLSSQAPPQLKYALLDQQIYEAERSANEQSFCEHCSFDVRKESGGRGSRGGCGEGGRGAPLGRKRAVELGQLAEACRGCWLRGESGGGMREGLEQPDFGERSRGKGGDSNCGPLLVTRRAFERSLQRKLSLFEACS